MQVISFPAGEGTVQGYLQQDYPRLQAHKVRPALVVCPGGAYQYCSPREKDSPALYFLSMGYQVFILEYSCREKAGQYRPLRELAAAMVAIRRHAEAWHLDPQRIAVMGFSAGGHLAESLAALWDDPELSLPAGCRPDAVILGYPVISTGAFCHEESAATVSGGDPEVRSKLHLPDRVGPGHPPVFLWHGGEDTSVPPENSMMLAAALRRQHIPFEYHLFETGAHGISTCSAEVETPDEVCRAWLALCGTWLNRKFHFTP